MLGQPSVFKTRRESLLATLDSSVFVLGAAPRAVRNNDVEHDYRQDSDFYYLTGIEEPECVLVLSNVHDKHRAVLFLRPRDPEREQWEGGRLGIENARDVMGIDEAYPISDFKSKLPEYLINTEHLHYRLGRNPSLDTVVLETLEHTRARARRGDTAPDTIHDLGPTLHEMRLIKKPEEIEAMRHAIAITAHAHHAAMRAARPGVFEYQLEAEILKAYHNMGSPRPAYGSIVGAGANATTLHYRRNRSPLRDGELVLIDAGCEWNFYASDITRVFPVNGVFSSTQKEIYQVVLSAQLAAIAAVKPNATLEEIHQVSVEKLVEGLIQLGLIEAVSRDDAIERELYRPYYMHRTSHWLGMDVHDVGAYYIKAMDPGQSRHADKTRRVARHRKPRPLQPGMVLTVEPGLYISPSAAVHAHWQGIGIRIEDDVVVTPQGCEVLSAHIPKEIHDVEKWMATP